MVLLAFLIINIYAEAKCWEFDDDFKIVIDEECLSDNPGMVDERITRTGYTVLHWAVENGQKDIAEKLLDMGADVDIQDFFGMTPLHTAAHNPKNIKPSIQNEIIELLLREGANPNLYNENGQLPIDLAQASGNQYLARFIMNWGENYGGAERVDDVIYSTEHWEEPEELQGLELLDIYNIDGLDCFVYRDRGEWINVDDLRYPFMLLYYDNTLQNCQNKKSSELFRKIAYILYYNLAKSESRDISLIPVSEKQKLSAGGTVFPSRKDLNLILLEAKKAAFRNYSNITNEAEKDSITGSIADSVIFLMKGEQIDTRIAANTFSKLFLYIIESNPESFVNILLFNWKNELKRKYRLYKNEHFETVETYPEAQKEMDKIYDILDMNQMAFAIEKLRNFDPDRGFLSELASDYFREAFENNLQIALFREYGQQMNTEEILSASSYFIRLPIIERTLLKYIMEGSPDLIDVDKIASMDKEAIDRVHISMCMAASKFDSMIIESEKPKKIERPLSVSSFDWEDSDVRPSKITVKLSPDKAEDMTDEELGEVLQFSSRPPYVQASEEGIEVEVEFEPVDEKANRTLGQRYESSLDSLHPQYKPEKIEETYAGISIEPIHIDIGTVEPYKGKVPFQFTVRNMDVDERYIEDFHLPNDISLVSPVPPYRIPPKSDVNAVLEFDPFNHSGRNIKKEIKLLFDDHQSRFVTMEAKVKQEIRGITVSPKQINLGSVNPHGGKVSMAITVNNNDTEPARLRTIGVASYLNVLKPELPLKIAPFSKEEIIIEFDPSGFSGKRIRKGFTLVFDNHQEQQVDFTAHMQWAMRTVEIEPREIDFGELRPDLGTITLVSNVKNKSKRDVRIVNVETPNYVSLENPPMPYVLQAGSNVNIEVQFDTKDFAGRILDDVFTIKFNNLEDEKVFIKGRVMEDASKITAEPSKIDIGKIETGGGKVSFRTKIWNNTNKTRLMEGISTGEYIKLITPELPHKIPPKSYVTLNFQIEPGRFSHNHVFSKDMLLVMDQRTRLNIPVSAEITDTKGYRKKQQLLQQQAEEQKQEDEEFFIGNVNLNNIKILINRDESWDKVDLRNPIGNLMDRGANVSIAKANLQKDGIVLTFSGDHEYDEAGVWIMRMIMESIGRSLSYADVKYVNRSELAGNTIIIFLPKLEE